MKVPVRIPVGGRQIRVLYVEQLVDEANRPLYGETVPSRLEIRINKAMNQSEKDVFETLFHELEHVQMQLTGHAEALSEGQEEALAYARQYMLSGLFVFNPRAGIRWKEVEFPWED